MASANTDYIEIDGSHLEGGGQILRISTALSVLLSKPIDIKRIRAGRKDGGLKAQHLTGIQLLGQMSKAKLEGDQLKSSELTFRPSNIVSGKYSANTHTAGSICLILQSALPCMIFANKENELIMKGGTNAENAPQIDYFMLCLQPLLSKFFDINLNCEIIRRGYYPKGGGEVYVKTQPIAKLNCIDLTQFGTIKSVYIRAYVAGFLPLKIAQTMADTARAELVKLGILTSEDDSASNNGDEKTKESSVEVRVDVVKEPDHIHVGVGTGLIVVVSTSTGCLLAGSALGKKGLPAPTVAMEAVELIRDDLLNQNCVDQFMQDQLIIFMALASGKSRIKCGELTLHTRTAIHVTQLLTNARFTVTSLNQNSNLIECEGMGYENKSA